MATREGYYVRRDNPVQEGHLKCAGVISPSSNIPSVTYDVFDVIIIGAGYAGLSSARDLCLSGFKVLLLEARDRLGGRTWTAEVEGHLYEMGGTWIYWGQPHVYREMSRYGYTKLLDSNADKVGCNYFTSWINGKPRNISYEEEGPAVERAFEIFCDVDGNGGRRIIPYPHDPHFKPEAKQWENISAAQRIDQVRAKLSELELYTLQGFVAAISGNDMNNTGFFDILRWWALSGYSTQGLYDYTETYKIPEGQSRFARTMFDEALATGNLKYAFDTLITSIKDTSVTVEATSTSGKSWSARRLISTIPLNILNRIQFQPPLSPAKSAAHSIPHIGIGAKVHMEVQGTNLRTWSAAAWPDSRIFSGRGDGITPAGNTHLVFFAGNQKGLNAQEDARHMAAEAKKLHEMEIQKVIWHNWLEDPLSEGIWCMFPPGYSFDHLDTLRARHGNVLFASADWALGWRGFIDGAIEEGTRAAMAVVKDLGFPRRVAPAL
ncbi:unnamed protein product [Clonostachys byssicola]|uniref:Amine oxidase n=1 Tax=Clonostachys byssicola TaxID=160290 RepID=A0A9N9Y074_9HYPO|nr:unnamed protein product [Clonostachys byssicola]